jgi:hypothetical protein
MTTYVISYELSQPGQDRGALFAAIKALADTSCHCLGSTWLVKTRMNAFKLPPLSGRTWMKTTVCWL